MLPFYLLAFAFTLKNPKVVIYDDCLPEQHVSTRNLCLPQTLFLATVQNLMEKSHKAFC